MVIINPMAYAPARSLGGAGAGKTPGAHSARRLPSVEIGLIRRDTAIVALRATATNARSALTPPPHVRIRPPAEVPYRELYSLHAEQIVLEITESSVVACLAPRPACWHGCGSRVSAYQSTIMAPAFHRCRNWPDPVHRTQDRPLFRARRAPAQNLRASSCNAPDMLIGSNWSPLPRASKPEDWRLLQELGCTARVT